jgi:hypothetical protein
MRRCCLGITLLLAAVAGLRAQPSPTPISPLTGNEQFVLQSNGSAPCTVPCFTTWSTMKNYSGAIQQLGVAKGLNLNATGDRIIPISFTSYIVTDIILTNASAVPTTDLVGQVYSAPSGGGVALTASPSGSMGTALNAALTAAAQYFQLAYAGRNWVLAAGASDLGGIGTVLTAGDLYLNIATPNGSPLTVDAYIFGLIIR